MLTIQSLKLLNFLSHSESTLEFGLEEKRLIDGKSGAGKSAIVEAMIWALYGKGRTDNRSLVKSGETSCSVEMELKDGAKGYRIVRKVSDSGKQSLSVDFTEDGEEWEPVKVNGVRGLQDWIETELVHASYALFINSVAYPQDNVDNFVKQTASKRKDLLLEIAGSADYDTLYGRAKDMLASHEEAVARLEGRISDKRLVISSASGVEEQISKAAVEISCLQPLLASLKKELEELEKTFAHVTSLRQSRNSLMEGMEKEAKLVDIHMQAIEDSEKQMEALKKFDPLFLDMKVEELKSKIARRDEIGKIIDKENFWLMEVNKLAGKKPYEQDHEIAIEEANLRLRMLVNNSDTKCPSVNGLDCPKLVDQLKQQTSYYEERIQSHKALKEMQDEGREEYVKQLEALGPKPEVPREELAILNKEISELKTYEAQAKEARDATTLAVAFAGAIEKDQKLMALLVEGIAKSKHSVLLLDTELSQLDVDGMIERKERLHGAISENEAKLMHAMGFKMGKEEILKMAQDAKKGLQALEEETLGYMVEVAALKAVKEAFGSKGIKNVIIDFLTPRLEFKINEVLSRLSEFRVEIDSQRDGVEGTVEGLFINIINPQGQRMEMNNYSGGEKVKIVVAISEALASLQNIGFRIMDEAILNLDEESTQNFVQVLDQIQDCFKQVFVISHIPEIKQQFENVMMVTKVNGDSFITQQ
jgi:DNA repair exonuclease SbcCD ATPase subunit